MRGVQKIDISSSTILRTIIILLVVWFLYIIRDILVMLLAAVVLASAIEPVAKRLRKYKVPRGLSVVIVYILVLAIVGLALTLIIPAIAQQSFQVAQSLPDLLAQLQDRYGFNALTSQDALQQVQENISQFGNNLANFSFDIFKQTRDVFSGLVSVVFVLIIAFYLVIEEDALKKLFRLVVPKGHVKYVEHIIDRIQVKLGRWVLAQLALGIIIGLIVGLGLWAIGVPHALALGVLAGVLEIIPVIGPIVAGVFGVVVALSQSLLLGIIALVFYVVVQQVENHALIPSIMKKATGLNPLVTLIAVLLGGRLAGVIGVILSVPVATMVSIFLSDFFTKSDDELAG